MRDYRKILFKILRDELLNKRKKIYLYFVSGNQYKKGELKIHERPYIFVDEELQEMFESIDKQYILSNLNPQYRVGWEKSYNKVENEIATGNKLIRLNQATTALFGPFFNKNRSAQSYNVYSNLYFNLKEVSNIINRSKLVNADKLTPDNKEFYRIDDIAKAIKEDYFKNNSTKADEETDIETETIDEFAKLKSISLSNFLNINDVKIQFSAGINVIIGENNTGKTGFMKLLYAIAKAYEEYGKTKGTSNERNFKEFLSRKLQKTFQSEDKIGGIVTKGSDKELAAKLIFTRNDIEDKSIKLSFKNSTKTEITNIDFMEIYQKDDVYKYNSVFIPAKEVLSIINAIKVALNYPTDGFDSTYEDLLKDIEPLFTKKSKENKLQKIAGEFEENIIEGEIEYNKNKGKYYYKSNDNQKFDLTMAAEGVKQIGIIPLLIRTGKITEGTILFLDEPDNNLNPFAIRKLIKTLFELAGVGVQIFISTHNHLLSQYLSLYNEHKETFGELTFPKSRFFAFYKDENGKTSIEHGDDLLDIQHNVILDEYVKLNDKETKILNL